MLASNNIKVAEDFKLGLVTFEIGVEALKSAREVITLTRVIFTSRQIF